MAKIPVIIETDPGCDDIIAILLALASPEIDILAFVVTYGNTDIDSSYHNIVRMYQALMLHISQCPDDSERFRTFMTSTPIVARGPVGPISGERHSAVEFHGKDGLGNISTRHPDLSVEYFNPINPPTNHRLLRFTDQPAVDVILDLVQKYGPRNITYIALGPLTLLTHVMRKDAATFRRRIGRIVCMGGALDVPGNDIEGTAEFNFYEDPDAVQEVLFNADPSKRLPLERFILLPLDITTPHELPFPIYQKYVDPTLDSPENPSVNTLKSPKAPLVHFTSSFLEFIRAIMLQPEYNNDAMELHDITALWCAVMNPPVDDESLPGTPVLVEGWEATRRHFKIETKGQFTKGMLVVDRRKGVDVAAPGDGQTHPGIAIIDKTPGPKALLNLFVKRVWGVEIEDSPTGKLVADS